MTTNVPLWQPTQERIAGANITDFASRVARETGRTFPDYRTLWRWSNDEREAFWRALWDYAGIVGERGERTLVDGHRMPGARWFPDAHLNFAENLLAARGGDAAADALVFRGEDRDRRHVTYGELTSMTSRMAAALQAAGITAGDRIAAYIPNCLRRLSRCSASHRSVGYGRRARRISACAAFSTASARSSPACS